MEGAVPQSLIVVCRIKKLLMSISLGVSEGICVGGWKKLVCVGRMAVGTVSVGSIALE